tara:strand:+ start:291 stop:545 length:255 start_codon:yes stop_codon:yes gene_type:complete
MEHCPLHCVNVACDKPTWLQENETFILTTVASLSAALGVIFSYFLKSRCIKVQCCCIKCDRDVPKLESSDTKSTYVDISNNQPP